MRIDSHHHFWQYSPAAYPWIDSKMSVLQRDFLPDDLRRELQASSIDAVVSVQARQSLEETEWLLELAAAHDFIRGVVGWVPLQSPEAQSEIERLSHNLALKSVRHVVQDEPEEDFLLGDKFNSGIACLKDYGLVYDILIFARQLPNTIRFVDQHPEQEFVLDHIAKPTIAADNFDRTWMKNFRELAKRENVTCKFSALVTEVRDLEWTISGLQPYWDAALEVFTPQRLMFGSDWPVCLLRSSYDNWVSAVEQLAAQLSPVESEQFWHQTATRAYHLR
jgi:L-fuconolactonase